jgi:hypothetical protein
MGLARTLTLAGAVALATATLSPWFGIDVDCGWTCYSPLPRDRVEWDLLVQPGPSTAFPQLGPWISVVLGLVVLGALAALVLDARRRAVPRLLAGGVAAGAVAILVRVATQPDVGDHHMPNAFVEVEPLAYAGTAAAIAAALGVIGLARRRPAATA